MNELTPYSEIARVLEGLGLVLRETRRMRQVSLRTAAEEIGVAVSTLTRIEHGEDAQMSSVVSVLVWLGKCHNAENPPA